MLRKIKAQFVAAGLALVAGAAVYLTTEVDYEALFPGGGIAVGAGIGWAIKMYRPEVEAYINTLDD